MIRWTPTANGRLRRRLLWLIALAALLLSLLLVALLLLTYRPTWFVPAAIDHRRLPDDKRAFVATLDAVGDALNHGRPADIVLDEAQVNRWLTGRTELPPAYQLDLGPLRAPQVNFLDGDKLRLAALVERFGLACVLWAELRVTLAEDAVVLQLETVRVGEMPVPRNWLVDALRAADLDEATRGRLSDAGAIVLDRVGVWPNGKRRFRLERAAITPEQMQLLLIPAPR